MDRLPTLLAMSAAGALVLAAASATNPARSTADHFLAYKTKATKGSTPFAPIANVRLADRFEDEVRFDVIKVREILVPARVDGEGPTDAVIHLQAYAIKAAKVCSDDARPCAKASECTTGAKCKRPGHAQRLGEVMLDSFGMRSIDVLKPDVLLVPSGKSLTGVPSVPDPATHAVDHFKCYKAKVAKGSSGLAKGTVVTLADQLTDPAKVLGITALTHLCTPAGKNGEPVKSVSGHLLCYKAKPAKGEPKHGKRIGVGINNQLGPLRRDTVSESSLCVPAAPGGIGPTPTPGGATPPSATPTPGVGICTPGATQSCYGGPAGTQGVGQCQAGIQTCEMGGTFGMCVGQVLPGMEVPGNGVDENCDGMVQPGPDLPPDPETVAPPVDPEVSTTVFAATTFLYTGLDPIQTGVAPGTIDLRRAAVVRGKVLDQTNAPLSGVAISILGHPELGQTLSRADGRFDLAVNGGGYLTVDYRKTGLLPAQRQVNVPWQDYVMAADVMLKALDQQMTTVDLTAATPIQVAQGSMTTDGDGTRRATLLFPQGTQAEMVMPDGSTHSMTTLSVRATEYTAGPNGAKAMPGELPPTSGYTYAVELSADEALAAGAKDLRFSQPVPFYVENFVGFPVGSLVPTGFYDRSKGLWIASDNGRVIQVISITGGLADLDLDGNGAIDDATALTALGITDAERQRLASLYTSGQELWRALIPHFTPWDCNWPYGPPDDATGPGGGGGGGAGPDGPDKPPRKPCKAGGSIIECQTQTLGEVINLTGTPFSLHYQSDRVPGRQAEANRLEIRLSGATLPASLQRIHLEIRVAGREFKESFAPAPNLVRTFTWDGKDVYDRTLQGRQRVFVRIGYEYVAQYYATQDSFAASYNRFGVPPLRAARGGGGAVVFSRPALRSTTPPIILWQDFTAAVGGLDIRSQGLGGWTLTAHHAYDLGNTLYLGDGSRRRAEELVSIMTTSAGGGTPGFPGDGGLATAAWLNFPQGVTLGADGSSYIAETNGNRIRRVGPDGMITTVAGNGGFCQFGCFGGDDGLATAAGLNNPRSVALGPDGSLYIADTGHDRIRRVGPDGIITTVAGNGIRSFSGDGGPATAASLNLPQDVALGPDGSVYIADGSNGRVRRVGPDGVITTIAGRGSGGPLGDGGPATAANLDFPSSVALGPDGSLYITDPTNHRIRRVETDGIITTVAGSGAIGFGDGGPATAAGLSGPQGVALGADGSLYIADTGRNRIRRVGPDGIITTVAGAQTSNFNGDGRPATAAGLATPAGVAVGPDGSVYVADTFHNRIRRVGSLLPGLSPEDFPIASEDGGEVFVFNSAGRHLRTLDALTGAVLFQFSYDGNDRLTAITDGDGNVTTIERDGSGNPTAIVAPFGRRTTLSLEANGYLASVTNPAGEAFQMTYTADGLLTQFTDPRSNASQITYDAQNRLLRDTNAAGGFQNLTRSDTDTTYTVSRSTALARTTTYKVEDLSTGNERQVVTFADGTQNQLLSETNGTQTLTLRTGTVRTSEEGPDPRFGMQAPVLTKQTFTTPGGLTRNVTTTRAASVSDPANLLSLTSQTDAVTINGRTYTRVYNAATRTFTLTTPAGRQPTATIDAQGRITQAAVAGLTPVQPSYDGRGRLTSLVQGSRSYTYEYDGQGFLSRVTDPLARVLDFTRDVAGRTTTITRPDGEQIHYGYDARGNVVSLTPPGRSAHAFEFTSVDLVERYEPPALGGAPTDVQVGYDLDRQVTELVYAGTNVELGYDAAGRLQTITFPQDTQTATYDAAGRLQALTTASGPGLTYGYDGTLLTDTTWSGSVAGTVHRVFNNDLRLASRTINGAHTQSFVYDADGFLTQAGALTLQRSPQNGLITGTTLGIVTDTRGFNGFAEWISYSATANAAALFSVQYTHDDGGRITGRSETVGGVTTAFTYGYDLVGRLTQVTENGATVASYTYDAAGNRLSRTTAGGTVNGVYDAQDRLTQYGTTTYSYTGNGELLSKTAGGQSTTYAYDVLGNLRGVTSPGGSQIEYVIDGRNRRVAKKVNGTKIQGFLYQDRLKPIAELDGNDAVVATFVYGSRRNVPDYMVKEGATYRIIADHLGSPRLVLDAATGTIAQRVNYDEFGRVVSDTNPGFQPFGFAGGLYDQATGLVRFGARDYDAQVGRWTSKDAVGLAGGPNLYAYVYDDPVNLIDRTGQAAEEVVLLTEASAAGGAIGSAIGIAGSVIFAIALLESLALENSALESADETGDDEGPNEGGAPDTLPSAPDSPSDGGVCGGDEGDKPTLPAPRNPDAPTLPAPRNPNAPTLPVPRNPNHPTQPAPRKGDTLRSGPQPTGGNPRSPNIYDQPIPKPPLMPKF